MAEHGARSTRSSYWRWQLTRFGVLVERELRDSPVRGRTHDAASGQGSASGRDHPTHPLPVARTGAHGPGVWHLAASASHHRSLLLRGDAGVGKSTLIQRVSVKAAAQGWRVLLSTAVEAEASVIGRGERLQCRAGDGAQRSADEDRGQFAAVVTEHEPKYGGNSPDCRTPLGSGEQNR